MEKIIRIRGVFKSQGSRVVFVGSLLITAAFAQVSVLTTQNDNARTGANLNETILNTSNVNVSQFGLLYTRSVDGYLYAQPLYVPNVNIPGQGTHNVVYVATSSNTVWAFDADQPSQSAPYWQVNLGPPPPARIGLLGTPVIDPVTSTLYVVAETLENGQYFHRLHALDITTGREKFGGPVAIQATVRGNGYDNVNGVVTFTPQQMIQRAGLLLVNGVVYVAFASWGDEDPWHGWIFGYNAANIQLPTTVYNTTPNGGRGGIWQSGVGAVSDPNGYIYFMSGNGDYDGVTSFGDSFVKMNTAGVVTDWFTPDDQVTLANDDLDLGSGGPLLIPGTTLLVGGGKQGIAYVVESGNMGHFSSNNGQIVESFQATSGEIHDLAYWNRSGAPLLYVWGSNDVLKAFQFANGTFGTVAVSQNSINANSPGGALVVSANGSVAGSGIVWATTKNGALGTLRAFDAADVSNELWNSSQNAARDSLGNFATFASPTIVNGKAYVPTFSNQLDVYGLLGVPTGNVEIWIGPTSVGLTNAGQQQFTASVAGTSNTAVTWSMSPSAGTLSASGLYTAPPISAPQTVTITATSVADPTKSASATVALTPPVTTGTATFRALDTVTQGTWQSVYGADGYNVVNNAVAYPGYVTVTPTGATAYTWSATTTDVRAMSVAPPGTGRIAAAWYNTSPTLINLVFHDTLPHRVAIYCLDWDTSSRAERMDILDANNILLGTQNVTNFHNGQYLVWELSGNVTIRVTNTGGLNSVISGLFFDPVPVSVSPASVALTVNGQQQFTATVTGTGNTAVTWSMSPSIGTLSAGGLYTAPATIAASQTVTVTATSVANTTESATASVTLAPVAVSVNPPSTALTASGQQQFTATVTGSGNTAVNWGMSPSLGTLSATGLYTAPATIPSLQSITITAISVADPTKSATASVTLAPVAVSVDPPSATLTVSGQQQFTATVTDTGNAEVTWGMSPSFGTLSVNGLYTAPGAISASQTITVTATSVADPTKSAATLVTLVPAGVPAGTATFLELDTVTQGTWKSVYGADGYNVINDTDSYPGYATVTSPGENPYTWSASTTDVRAPQTVFSGTRIAAAWYNTSPILINLAFNDTLPHQVAIYCLDWDTSSRAERVDILDANNLLLASQNVTNFHSGQYLVWELSGNVIIRVTGTAGIDAVVSGLFFDPVPPVLVYPLSTTLTVNGQQKFAATVTGAGNTGVNWSTSPSTGAISASGLYTAPVIISATQVVTITATSVADPTESAKALVTLDVPTGTATFAALDTVTQGNWQSVYGANGYNVINGAVAYPSDVTVTPANVTAYTWSAPTTDVRALSDVSPDTGRIAAAWYNTSPMLINLAFNDTLPHRVAIYCLDWDSTSRAETVDILDGNNILLATQNVTNFNNGQYLVWELSGNVTIRVTATAGIDAVISGLFFDPAPPVLLSPASAILTVNGQQQFTATVTGAGNTGVNWSMSPPVGNLSVSGLYTAPATILASQTITVTATSAANPALAATSSVTLNPVVVSVNPPSAALTINGQQQFTATVTGTSNTAVTWSMSPLVGTLSPTGLYTAPATISTSQTITITATSVTDPTKSANASVTLTPVAVSINPSSVTLTVNGQQQFAATVTGTSNEAVNWSMSPSIGTLSAGGLYTAPGAISATQVVTITATTVADPTKSAATFVTLYPPGVPTGAAAFVALDTGTQGNWISAYGAGGYNVINDASTYPSYVTVTPADVIAYTWSASTTDVRALSEASPSSGRIAAAWYNTSPMLINLAFNDTLPHQVAIYCLDWDTSSRAETVDIMDANNTLLATQNVTNFHNGEYLVWELSGSVSIRVTGTAGVNAAISGLFFDPVPPVSVYPRSAALMVNGQQQFAATLAGTGNTGVNWSMSPLIGTLSAGGLYTAPGAISATQVVTITATSVADPAKSATALVTLAAPTGTATFAALDTVTQGTWQSVYGADGYNVINDAAAYPGYVNVTPAGVTAYTWSASTTDVRALSDGAPGTGRIAAAWYDTSPMLINLAFNDTSQHKVAIYCLDWDTLSRAERVDILDANNTLLATQNVTNFHNGEYLVWELSGNVTIRVTSTAGANAVISGLFFH